MAAVPGAVSSSALRLRQSYRNIALWTFQGWLALFYLGAGYAKLTEPHDRLVVLLHWPAATSLSLVRGVGVAEIALALAMVAPILTGWRGRCVVVGGAALLLSVETTMLAVHGLRGEVDLTLINAALIGLTAPVVWFRGLRRQSSA